MLRRISRSLWIMRRCGALMTALAMMGAAARSANAAPGCKNAKLVERPGLSDAFRDAARTLRGELDALAPEECTDITLILEADGPRARFVAVAHDGQTAERDVRDAASLHAIAFGLIAAASPEPPPRKVEDDPMRESAADQPPKEDVVAAPLPREKEVHLAVSMEVGARLAGPTRVVLGDVQVRADFLIHDWIVGTTIRVTPVVLVTGSGKLTNYAYDEASIGLDFGRRYHLGSSALELTVSPTIAIMTERGDGPEDDIDGTNVDFFLRGTARCLLPGLGRWRPAVGIDAEVAPFSVATPLRPDPALPPLPSWSLGFHLGVAGDLL